MSSGLRELALRRVVVPLGGLLVGQAVMRHVRFVEQAERWSRSHLDGYVDERLARLIRLAHDEVPMLRRAMEERGVGPEQFTTRADLPAFPVLTKAQIRASAPAERVRPVPGKTWETCSSGSTGENFFTRYDAQSEARCRALNLIAFGWGGWPIGAEHLQTGMSLARGAVKRIKDVVLGCHYESAFDLTPAHLDRIVDRILRRRLRHIRGYPGSIYYIARRMRERGERAPMESVVTWGDNLFAHYRELIEDVFQRRVTDVYGCGEGMLVAAQCERGRYHVMATDVHMEIVDEQGRPVAPGTMGHVLLTRLHPGPQPFLRYRVGDMALAGDGEPCPCGRPFPTFGRIEGRDTDVIVTPAGNRLIVHFFTGILEYFRDIESFQVLQDDPASCTVRVVAARGAGDDLECRIVDALREKGADLTIHVERVAQIPPSPSGKRRFVVSSLHPRLGPG